mmetsp:Transcript_12319/g.22379  ORF Transcript_12319/g.22379 Transcript_12319/m.22379 type:complete len:243 (-) Transcript_12319:568-1296(-)
MFRTLGVRLVNVKRDSGELIAFSLLFVIGNTIAILWAIITASKDTTLLGKAETIEIRTLDKFDGLMYCCWSYFSSWMAHLLLIQDSGIQCTLLFCAGWCVVSNCLQQPQCSCTSCVLAPWVVMIEASYHLSGAFRCHCTHIRTHLPRQAWPYHCEQLWHWFLLFCLLVVHLNGVLGDWGLNNVVVTTYPFVERGSFLRCHFAVPLSCSATSGPTNANSFREYCCSSLNSILKASKSSAARQW